MVYCYTGTGNVPAVDAVRAVIDNGHNQTLMALYTIPNGKIGYLCQFYSSLAGAKKTAEYQIDLFIRPNGQVFQLKNRKALHDDGTTIDSYRYEIPEVIPSKADIAMRVKLLTAAVTASSMSAGFDITLVDD